MNTLSWMIYAADVVGGLNGTFGFIAGAASVAAGGSGLAWLIMGPTPSLYSFDDKESKVANHNGIRAHLRAVMKWAAIIAPAALFTASLIPSENTVYAIAASEMGEEVVKSPTATKAMKALDAWLDRQITDKPAAE